MFSELYIVENVKNWPREVFPQPPYVQGEYWNLKTVLKYELLSSNHLEYHIPEFPENQRYALAQDPYPSTPQPYAWIVSCLKCKIVILKDIIASLPACMYIFAFTTPIGWMW